MNRFELMELEPGDEVFWEDPDAGACSRHLVIQEIEIEKSDLPNPVAMIWDKDGNYLEAFASELRRS